MNLNDLRIHLRASANFSGRGVNVLLIAERHPRPEWYYLGPDCCFAKETPGDEPRPTFLLRQQEAQQLMDDLWTAGVRPTEGAGTAGAMAAVQAHLKDLQKIVFSPAAVFIPKSP